MSTLLVNSIQPQRASDVDYFLARAWVNFNGTGTVAIRADGNVSSITDNGTGVYTVNYSSSFSDASWCGVGGMGSWENYTDDVRYQSDAPPATSSVKIRYGAASNAADAVQAHFSVIR